MIPINRPFLPPKEEYIKFVKEIWERNWLTNNGPLVIKLENELVDILNLKHLKYVSNGTIALQIAIKALDLKGDIITTPFSYVATTSSIVWEGCNPVFVDINESSLNIDPDKIEKFITPNTSAILATHVFGNICEVNKISEIANRYGLKVIYDAAHAFGIEFNGKSIFSYGDISTTSFHSTKLFHTIEGGALVTNDNNIDNRIGLLRNFGHDGPDNFSGVGINGKNSEFHAAMGLLNLNYIEQIIEKRKILYTTYLRLLKDVGLGFQVIQNDFKYNYSYFPIICQSEKQLLSLVEYLSSKKINTRRYFYPSLSSLNYIVDKQYTPISDSISKRILCLPLFYDLTQDEVVFICDKIKEVL